MLTQVWCLALLLFALRRRPHWQQWLLVAAALAMEGVNDFSAGVELGARWTRWTIAQAIQQPLFSIFGGTVNVPTLCTALLLFAVPLAAWHSMQQQKRRNAAFEQELRGARELQQFLIPQTAPEIPGFAISSVYRPRVKWAAISSRFCRSRRATGW